MLIVKAKEGFAIQGNGRLYRVEQGGVVAEEIFKKDFPGDSGQVILKGLIKDGVLAEAKDGKGKPAKTLDKMKKKELIAHAKELGIEVNVNETEDVIIAAIEAGPTGEEKVHAPKAEGDNADADVDPKPKGKGKGKGAK